MMLPSEILAPFLVHVPVDLAAAARALKIEILPANLPPEDTIHLELGGERWRAFLNRAMTRSQIRFATAHVIAHFILHRDLVEPLMADRRIHREDFRFRSRLDEAYERQANRYAMSLLVPRAHARALPRESDAEGMARKVAEVFDLPLPLARLCAEDYGLVPIQVAAATVLDHSRSS